LFFKWIKQHLRIKKFLCNSENAVKTQIWCAVFTYVLIAIVKKELQMNASLYPLLQILSVSVFEKTEVSSTLQLDRHRIDSQMNLFTFQPDITENLSLFIWPFPISRNCSAARNLCSSPVTMMGFDISIPEPPSADSLCAAC
jgi:hypothetical protein